MLKCPHCGWQYDPKKWSKLVGKNAWSTVPTHDETPPFRAVCPGSGQTPKKS